MFTNVEPRSFCITESVDHEKKYNHRAKFPHNFTTCYQNFTCISTCISITFTELYNFTTQKKDCYLTNFTFSLTLITRRECTTGNATPRISQHCYNAIPDINLAQSHTAYDITWDIKFQPLWTARVPGK